MIDKHLTHQPLRQRQQTPPSHKEIQTSFPSTSPPPFSPATSPIQTTPNPSPNPHASKRASFPVIRENIPRYRVPPTVRCKQPDKMKTSYGFCLPIWQILQQIAGKSFHAGHAGLLPRLRALYVPRGRSCGCGRLFRSCGREGDVWNKLPYLLAP